MNMVDENLMELLQNCPVVRPTATYLIQTLGQVFGAIFVYNIPVFRKNSVSFSSASDMGFSELMSC